MDHQYGASTITTMSVRHGRHKIVKGENIWQRDVFRRLAAFPVLPIGPRQED